MNTEKINFLVSLNFLEERLQQLKRFNSSQERDALLIDDDESDIEILKCLTDIKPINNLEASAFLLKLREISVGDELELMVTCPHCKIMNDPRIDLSTIFALDNPYFLEDGTQIPVGLFEDISEIINTLEADKLSMKEYNELERILEEQNNKIFLESAIKYCRKCQGRITIDIEPRSILSKSSLSSLYQEYVNISLFSNNGKLDIDSMYPFEREIFASLIADKMKEET